MDFSKLNKQNAKAFFDKFMAGKNSSLENLFTISQQDSGPKRSDLDFSRDSLVKIWQWACPKLKTLETQPSTKDMPFWYDPMIRNARYAFVAFDPKVVRLVEGLAYYWGDTLVKHIPDAKWDIDPFPASELFCHPRVSSEFFSAHPIQNVSFLVSEIRVWTH